MKIPTPLQQQIEYLVTNGRGYTPQITPTLFLGLLTKTYLIDFYAALEQQRLQDTLGSMERQQSSPTLDALFTSDLDRILRSTARPGSDIELIKNYEDPRRFSKITPRNNFEFPPLKERFPNKEFEEINLFPNEGANAGHVVPLDPDKMRAFRARLLAMGIDPFAADGPDPGKNWDFLHPSIPPNDEYFKFVDKKDFHLSKPWGSPYLEQLKLPKPNPVYEDSDRPRDTPPKIINFLDRVETTLPKENPNPEEHLPSQDPLADLLKRLDQENRKKDSKKKWIE
ncbi:hypothetical protein J4208_03435 [Candidatus Woesearchaeota archaeon]|nr:hypothetical protein [Candidatus Woesearchaeota archaeon]